MLTAREFSFGIYGAWRMARLDNGAMQYFDASIGGLWKSFYVALIVLPAILIITIFNIATIDLPEQVGLFEIAVVEASSYVMKWVAFPLLMTVVADMMQRGERYTGYIVALNWAKLLEVAVVLPAFLMTVASGQALNQPNPLYTIVFFAVTFYFWFVAKTALGISGWMAGGIVILQIAVDGFIEYAALILLR